MFHSLSVVDLTIMNNGIGELPLLNHNFPCKISQNQSKFLHFIDNARKIRKRGNREQTPAFST